MSMDRRSFMKLLSGGAVGMAALDLEKMLWIPGQKTIFVPAQLTVVKHVTDFDGPVWLGTAGEHLLSGDVVTRAPRGAWRRVEIGEKPQIVGLVVENMAARGERVLIHDGNGGWRGARNSGLQFTRMP